MKEEFFLGEIGENKNCIAGKYESKLYAKSNMEIREETSEY